MSKKAFFYGAAGCILVPVIGVALLVGAYFWHVGKGVAAHEDQVEKKLAPITEALAAGKKPDKKIVKELAQDPGVRNVLYERLKEKDMQDLFPAKYRTAEKHAESKLVYWCNHPNELKQSPDKIELMKVIAVDAGKRLGKVDYYLFRFRADKPNWASEYGWIAGVAGPYVKGDKLDEESPRIAYSEFNPYDGQTPQEHVDYYHEMAQERGLYDALAEHLGK